MNAMDLDVEAIAARVKAAPDADALKAIVTELSVLPGSHGAVYSAEQVIDCIDAALHVPELVNSVTRSLGLRDKVKELLGLPKSQRPAPDLSRSQRPAAPDLSATGARRPRIDG